MSALSQGELSFSMPPCRDVVFTPRKKTRAKKKESIVEKNISRSLLPITTLHEEIKSSLPLPLSVTQVTKRVARLLEEEIGEVWIQGEISNYRKQSSGHHYFTLKDAESQIACVLFSRSAAMIPALLLADGMAVQLRGEVTVYQPRGQYQVIVNLVQKKGEGILQAEFAALKEKLAGQGLFDAAGKRPLPRFPKRIGIVTSPTGAALADFLQVLHRRNPGLQVVISPVRVQGQGAAGEIAAAIEELNTAFFQPLDLIVLTRGGGSLEDLWEFNHEILVRAIVASHLPVVSAVGHEIDFTLSDFAADLRAPTPSAAAELIAADSIALLEQAQSLLRRIARETRGSWNELFKTKIIFEKSPLFRTPERFFLDLRQRIDDVQETLENQIARRLEVTHVHIDQLALTLKTHHPRHILAQARARYSSLTQRLHHHLDYRLQLLLARMENLRSSLAALSPKATLARGFTITRSEEGTILTSSTQVTAPVVLKTEFADGIIESTSLFS
jgi:exodeoxyribonuclease VII large subunit